MYYELYAAIALWCGIQTSYRNLKEIDLCRERIIACEEKRQSLEEHKDCFKKEKLSK